MKDVLRHFFNLFDYYADEKLVQVSFIDNLKDKLKDDS